MHCLWCRRPGRDSLAHDPQLFPLRSDPITEIVDEQRVNRKRAGGFSIEWGDSNTILSPRRISILLILVVLNT